jgi:hypothetical protein
MTVGAEYASGSLVAVGRYKLYLYLNPIQFTHSLKAPGLVSTLEAEK